MLPLKLQGLPVTSDPWGTQLGPSQLKENYSCPSPLEEGSLRAHNFYRARHGSSELTLSQMLSDSAKKWAEILSRMKYIHHSSRNIRGIRIGENIAVILSNKPVICSGEEVTAQWYSEVEQYNYEQGGDTSTCGHFSQIVWRSSRQMGIGQASTTDGHSIIVAHYYPAGNISGHYNTNVLPPFYPDGIPVINQTKPAIIRHSKQCQRSIPRTKDSSSSVIEIPARTSLNQSHESPENLQSNSPESSCSVINTSARTLPINHTHQSPKSLPSNSTNSMTETSSRNLKHQSPKIFQSVTQTLAMFSKDCLETHNKYRHQHHSPPLQLSEQLSKLAQKWAESIAKESYISYSSQLYKGQQIGQNIVFRWTKQGTGFSGSEVTDLWYSQVKNFDFSHYKHRMDTGHFTQLVWKNSQYIGIGKAGNSVGAVAVVVFYFPAGNIQEELQDNVFKTF
ncbi:wall PRY3-like isoform X2 [Octopus vulgaris]|uniref:Wall PRY3-like isoform X2 n=1 Tax=Octopus vulgaris TaxID=6645 RepID=A0AA36BQ53_OCTVU|nr:wall PRY3-like isoform X2 [Octopus vulgaris]